MPGVIGLPPSALKFDGTLGQCEPSLPGTVGLYARWSAAREPAPWAHQSTAARGIGRPPAPWIQVPISAGASPWVRIEPADAPDAGGRPLSILGAAQARELALRLTANPTLKTRLIEMRGGARAGLAEWAAAALLTRELKILVRAPSPGAALKPPEAPKAAASPLRAPAPAPAPTTHWIELVLTNESGVVMPKVAYQIVTADRQQHSGVTDAGGRARLDDIVAGPCDVSFPDLDDEEWKKA